MKVHAAPAPGAGTGLFASLKLDCGTDIFTSPLSFVAVLDTPRLEDTCSNCFGKKVYNRQVSPHKDDNPQLKACLGCKVVKYCDKVVALPTMIKIGILTKPLNRTARLNTGVVSISMSALYIRSYILKYCLQMRGRLFKSYRG